MDTFLPVYEKVFFVHYQCDDFKKSTQIYNLQIFANGKVKEYSGENEAHFIKAYCKRVKELCGEGLIPVHWNQNRPYFGIDHIVSRYNDLTNEEIELDYVKEINLADLLIDKYGDDYADHPRLDNLACLNEFNGSWERDAGVPRVFSANRVMLISKIYYRAEKNTLITNNSSKTKVEKKLHTEIISEKKERKFADYLMCNYKESLALALKNEFVSEKGKLIRYLIEALIAYTVPLLALCNGEKKAFYNEMKFYFDRNIGSYNGIFGYKYDKDYDHLDFENIQKRLEHVISTL